MDKLLQAKVDLYKLLLMKVAGDLTASEAAVMQVLANDPDIQKILDEALKHDRDRNK